jgi:hypothetical protein
MASPEFVFRDTSVNTTTKFLDPAQMEQIINDLTQAEGQARQDIATNFAAAVDTAQGTDFTSQFREANERANTAAVEQLARMSGLDIGQGGVGEAGDIQSMLEATPGFQFRRDQGQQAVERSAAARGTLESGSVLKELNRFGQGLASQEFAAEQGRLAQLAGLTGNVAIQGGQQGSQAASLQAQQGSALAGIAQSAAQQRSSSLLQGGKTTTKNIESTLLPKGSESIGTLAKAGVQVRL